MQRRVAAAVGRSDVRSESVIVLTGELAAGRCYVCRLDRLCCLRGGARSSRQVGQVRLGGWRFPGRGGGGRITWLAGGGPAASRPNGSQAAALSRVPISVITLIAAIGVLVSSVATRTDAHGLRQFAWADRAYWLGQALILAPMAGRLLSRRRLSNGGTIILVVVLTVAEYLLKVNYSPLGFAFNDEFLHWRGTTNMLQTGKLFEQSTTDCRSARTTRGSKR